MKVLQDLLGAKWTADNGSRYTDTQTCMQAHTYAHMRAQAHGKQDV